MLNLCISVFGLEPGIAAQIRGPGPTYVWRDAGCGMGHTNEKGCGIREILRAANGMKISWRDRGALISIVGMRDSF